MLVACSHERESIGEPSTGAVQSADRPLEIQVSNGLDRAVSTRMARSGPALAHACPWRHVVIAVLPWVLGLGTSACTDVSGSGGSSAPIDTTAGAIQFRLAGPNGAAIVVPAYIDGRGPFDLILDTGATLTCLDSSLARELALPVQHATIGAGIGVGGSGRVQLVRIDSLRVGRSTVTRLNACALNLSNLRIIGGGVRGLLGLNFVRNFRVTLDFDRQTLHLTKPTDHSR
jgi:aspartyl protease